MPYQGRKLMEWDIVQRLREGRTNGSNLLWSVTAIHREAADEIERLREALRYYAKNHYPDIDAGPWGVNSADFGDVARAALGEDK